MNPRDIRVIFGAILVCGAAGCAHAPLAAERISFNCTRISELGELELTTQCGDLRRSELQVADSRSAVISESPTRVERIRPEMIEVREMRPRVVAPRPEVFRPRPMRPQPPPKH